MSFLKIAKPENSFSERDEKDSSHSPSIRSLLKALVKHGASDLHLKVGRAPMLRIDGKLILTKLPSLNPENIKKLFDEILNEKNKRKLEEKFQVDFSFSMNNMGRFRANIYMQRGSYAGVIRMIPVSAPKLETLGLPSVLKELCAKSRGLILVTGSTGAGKSTTMAAMIHHINETKPVHIVTIEDPIEFLYGDIKASVSQREVGTDASSAHEALIGALRQDPDVITVGEMREQETIHTALRAAETGHLVLSTMHTNDAKSTIQRILDSFPSESQNQIRIQLSNSLLAIVSQRLVNKADGQGRMAVCEILINSPTIASLIFENQLDKIQETIANSNSYYKMQTYNQVLESLVRAGTITLQEAIANSNQPEDLQLRLNGFIKEAGY